MSLLKTIRKRSFLNEAAYVALNIGLAIAVLVIVLTVVSPIPALLLVLLSKWRIVAVRPRYWVANLLANLVDIVVGISAVLLMYSVIDSPYAFYLQVLLALLFAGWLIGLKPQSTQKAVVWQSFVALIAGSSALFVMSYVFPITLMVIGMAGLGYAVARHTLGQFEEDHLQFLSIVWAFIMAAITWVLSHWLIGYSVPMIDIKIPQATIFIGLIALVSYLTYASFRAHGAVRPSDVAAPIAFSVSVMFVLLVFFNNMTIGVL